MDRIVEPSRKELDNLSDRVHSRRGLWGVYGVRQYRIIETKPFRKKIMKQNRLNKVAKVFAKGKITLWFSCVLL